MAESGFPWDKALSIGGTLISTILGSNATSDAAKTTSQATQQAAQLTSDAAAKSVDEIKRQYDLTRTDLSPWRTSGTNALALLTALLTPGALPAGTASNYLTQLPGYQFQNDQALKAITNRQSADNQRFTGRGYKELGDYVAGSIAGPAYQNWLTQLAGLSNSGENAAGQGASLGASTAGQIANINTGAAQTVGNLGVNAASEAANAAIAKNALYGRAANTISDTLVGNPFMTQYLQILAQQNQGAR